jgi:hypothetical protein
MMALAEGMRYRLVAAWSIYSLTLPNRKDKIRLDIQESASSIHILHVFRMHQKAEAVPCREWPASGPGRLRPGPWFLVGVSAEAPGSSMTSRDHRAPSGCARCPAVTVMLEAGGAGTYTQRAIPGRESRLGSFVCKVSRAGALDGGDDSYALIWAVCRGESSSSGVTASWPGARRPGPPRPEGGAGAGPAAPQAPP